MYQCCWDHEAAASAGHLHCLQRLQDQGHFLGLDSPERGSAGEVRRLQVWDAALSSCKAGHARVLSWLFASGWPAEVDAHVPWNLRDVVKPENWDYWMLPYTEDIQGTYPIDKIFLPEVQLCRYAVQNPDSACLEALINSGCRSRWLCDMAALEGRADLLDLAIERGCPVGKCSCYFAARAGHLPILQRLRCLGRTRRNWFLTTAATVAVDAGKTDCLKALLRWNRRSLDLQELSVNAMRRGHLECLKVLLGYVFSTDVSHIRMREHTSREPALVNEFPLSLFLGFLLGVACLPPLALGAVMGG
jgi:hypothetical protein